MYISRNSIVIKTNYETRRRDRGVARRRAGAHAKKLGKHPLRSFVRSSNQQKINRPIADRQTDRQTIFDSRPEVYVPLTRSRPLASSRRSNDAFSRPSVRLMSYLR